MSQFQDAYGDVDPNIIQLQGEAGQTGQISETLVPQGALTNLNGLQASSQTFATSGAISVSVSSVGTTHTFTVSGYGALALLNAGAAVANLSTVASAGYVQAEAQAVIDKVNALLNSLRAAGVIAP